MKNFSGACFICIKSGVFYGKTGVNEHHDLGSAYPLKLGSMISINWGLRDSTRVWFETCWNLTWFQVSIETYMKPYIAMLGLIMLWFHFHMLEFPRVLRLLSYGGW